MSRIDTESIQRLITEAKNLPGYGSDWNIDSQTGMVRLSPGVINMAFDSPFYTGERSDQYGQVFPILQREIERPDGKIEKRVFFPQADLYQALSKTRGPDGQTVLYCAFRDEFETLENLVDDLQVFELQNLPV